MHIVQLEEVYTIMSKEENNAKTEAAAGAEKKPEDKEAAKAKAAASRITDFVNEKELNVRKAAAAVASLSKSMSEKVNESIFEGELADSDVAVLMAEADMDKERAQKHLRTNGGNLAQAMQAFIAAQ